MPIITEWLKRIVPKNIAGIIGVVQALVPLVKELVVVVIRIAAIVVPGKLPETLIVKVQGISDKIEGLVTRVKNLLLQ